MDTTIVQHRPITAIKLQKGMVGARNNITQSGFSLVELLVGVIIGLLGTLVIFQVFAVNEGQKRTTTSGSDAEQSGAFSLYNLITNVRMGGNNLTNAFPANTSGDPQKSQLAGCNIPAAPPITQVALRAIPVMITDGGGGLSNTLTVLTGASAVLSSAVALNGPAAAGSSSINLQSAFGFNAPVGATPGDVVLFVESLTNVSQNCTLRRIATVPAAVAPATVAAGAGTVTVTAAAPGLPVSYSKDAALYNLGPTIRAMAYSVYTDNLGHSRLIETDLTLGPAQAPFPAGIAANSTIVADQVVNLRAQYGVDNDGSNDGVIDAWVEPTGIWAPAALTSAQIPQIRAIRLGIIVRSSQTEKPTPGVGCNTTPTMPSALSAAATTPAKTASPAMDTTNMTNPSCYRYKTYETVIPIRNPIWSDSNLR